MIPSPYTLTVRTRTEGAPDAFGNPTETWADRAWQVRSVAPGAMADPANPNRDLSQVAYSVHADADSGLPTRLDRVVLDDEDYDVDGDPADWTRGPWAHPAAGVVVLLTRSEG